MDDEDEMPEYPEYAETSMSGDEMVHFAGIFTRLPTEEEKEMLLRFQANQVASDMARWERLSATEQEMRYRKYVEEDRLTNSVGSSVTELPHLGIRLFTVHYFSITNTVNKTNHSVAVSTFRYVIRENNEIEPFEREMDVFDL